MRVLVADDHSEVRAALHLLLEQEPELTVVGDVVEAGGLLPQVETTCPDLLLLDWELPGLRAVEIVPALRALCPQLSVIALSGLPEARAAALSAEVDAFVSKGDPPECLLALVEECRRDGGGATRSRKNGGKNHVS
jgi:two-component system nitrate/nitrite response regulator NarL